MKKRGAEKTVQVKKAKTSAKAEKRKKAAPNKAKSPAGAERETRVQHSPGGLKGRWIVNSLSLVIAILVAAVVIFSVATSNYYYSSMRENLKNRAVDTANFFNRYMNRSYDQFYSNAERYVLEFTEKNLVELQILDAGGKILFSSSGLTSGMIPGTSDVVAALESGETSTWSGEDTLSGEDVMSVTSPLYFSNGDTIGAVRYVSSMEKVHTQVFQVVVFASVMALLVLVLVIISNQYFLRSIVQPVLKINAIAKEIAEGRYGMRLHKIYDDEIGELCDTINYMSDEISRAERMKNDFISSVSHELRTPLTAIAGWSETLMAGGAQDTEEVMLGLEIIQKESRRLTNMVEELLDFAKIESGRMKLAVEVFDVGAELYEVSFMYSNLLRSDGMQVGFSNPDAPVYINGDRHRLRQVFLNVVDNASKYGKSGGKIDISLEREEELAVIRVRDYGAGIPEKELPFVKEKFFKGSSKQRGSGIGLAVSDEIVTMHGGTLTIKSRVGEGTLVIISLPALEEAPGTRPDSPAPEELTALEQEPPLETEVIVADPEDGGETPSL